jgi:hypothetical protein
MGRPEQLNPVIAPKRRDVNSSSEIMTDFVTGIGGYSSGGQGPTDTDSTGGRVSNILNYK